MSSNKSVTVGRGNECPKCRSRMERRKHPQTPVPNSKARSHYFSEWDCCRSCKHVQHYEEFKVKFPDANIRNKTKEETENS